MSAAAAIDRRELDELLEAIAARYGYDLRGYAPASIGRRVQAAMAKAGLASVSALKQRALHDSAFFAELIDVLTVGVSEMFRDPPFYAAFRTQVVPLLRTYPLLRIWHAGCATGEEAYSTAVLLAEEGLYERAHIYGTDLNEHAIEAAKLGMYPTRQLARFADNHARAGGVRPLSAYVTVAYERMAVNDAFRRNVSFFQHDLVGDQDFGEMQVIFCRNVLIYFDRPLQDRVLDKFERSLCAGGFLCLGSSERLPNDRPRFDAFDASARIYRYNA